MEKFELNWNSAFEIGIASVDNQHKKLFDLLKNLASAFVLNKEKHIITEMFFELEDYTKYHFKEEEELFLNRNKIINENHYEQHRSFEKKLHDLKFDYVSENKAITMELLTFLRNWLMEHILVIDKNDLNYLEK